MSTDLFSSYNAALLLVFYNLIHFLTSVFLNSFATFSSRTLWCRKVLANLFLLLSMQYLVLNHFATLFCHGKNLPCFVNYKVSQRT